MPTNFTLAALRVAAMPALVAAPMVAMPMVAMAANAPSPPAGAYVMDKSHSSVTFRVSHLGFSHYTASFRTVDGRLKFDPDHPGDMSVEATIDPMSLELNAPPAGFHDQMMSKTWFNAAQFTAITFRSSRVEVTGANTARVTGDFTLHGVTKPVTLEVTYNGGYPPMQFDPGGARVGFSAHGTFKRSAFGMGMGVPAPGSNLGVGDDVEVAIETEFSSKLVPPSK